jgi:benzodiazapine receptor
MAKSNLLKLIVSIVFTLGLGSLGGIFTVSEIPNWYAGLQKPSFNPPNFLFGPVWTILYILMGISFYLVWKKSSSKIRANGIALFIIQFTLNFFWSIIFFKYHLIFWAFIEIIVMWVFILFTIFSFAKLNKTAAWLLVPYISWVSFAAILNFAILHLNQ